MTTGFLSGRTDRHRRGYDGNGTDGQPPVDVEVGGGGGRVLDGSDVRTDDDVKGVALPHLQ